MTRRFDRRFLTMDGLPATEQEQARFFAQLQEGYAAASARAGEIVRDFRVAGTSVRLRFAGEALIPAIVPGLACPILGVQADPHCEICLWDSETTGVRLAPSPRPWRDFTASGNIWGFDSLRYRSAYQWGEGSVSGMDRETRQAMFWVRSSKQLPPWVLAAPLRSILHWWMELNGRQLVHAAAVGYDGRAVLMPGRGGSGKSSTSLACLLGGLDFISDDYLALALDPEPRAYRLYSTAKLDPQNLNLYPELATRCRTVHQPGFDKVVLFLEDEYREQLRESLPLKLVLKPRFSGVPETTLGPVEPSEIERALASETLVHLPHAGVQTLEFLGRVSNEIPRAAIHLGTDRSRIPAAIQGALEARITAAPNRRAGERRPFVSVIVHLCEEDHEELRSLAAGIEEQGYPRTELIVAAGGPACAMTDDAASLPGSVRFLSFPEAVVNALAWNCAIRECFAELLVLLEPGDRLQPGALDALVRASERDPGVAWVRGRVVSSEQEDESRISLRGALIRKSAFRECGLFTENPFLQGSEHRDWLRRVEQKQLTGIQLDTVTLHAAGASKSRPCRLPPKVALGMLKAHVDRRRQLDEAGNRGTQGTILS